MRLESVMPYLIAERYKYTKESSNNLSNAKLTM
jgi:hypothetical protein